MVEKPYKTISLKNKLKLEIWDQCRPVAGDRWLVKVEARIDVPFEIKYIESFQEKDKMASILKKIFGESLPYRYAIEKNFVDQDRKQEVFQQFVDTLEKKHPRIPVPS